MKFGIGVLYEKLSSKHWVSWRWALGNLYSRWRSVKFLPVFVCDIFCWY